MKILKWYKAGEPIPSNSNFIKSEYKIVGYTHDFDAMYDYEDPVYEEFYLYEVEGGKEQ